MIIFAQRNNQNLGTKACREVTTQQPGNSRLFLLAFAFPWMRLLCSTKHITISQPLLAHVSYLCQKQCRVYEFNSCSLDRGLQARVFPSFLSLCQHSSFLFFFEVFLISTILFLFSFFFVLAILQLHFIVGKADNKFFSYQRKL